MGVWDPVLMARRGLPAPREIRGLMGLLLGLALLAMMEVLVVRDIAMQEMAELEGLGVLEAVGMLGGPSH
jgi:hypothetical protein